MLTWSRGICLAAFAGSLAGCTGERAPRDATPAPAEPEPLSCEPYASPRWEGLDDAMLPATADISHMLDRVRDPCRDPLPSPRAKGLEILRGYLIFTRTQRFAVELAGNGLACSNCHLNAGQRDGALPLVGRAQLFPEYNNRAGRMFSLEDRIVGCFLRSLDDASLAPASLTPHENMDERTFPSQSEGPVRAVAAYIRWLDQAEPSLARGRASLTGRRADTLDVERGKELYTEKCEECHGEDGEARFAMGDLRPGPLWGARSWNDGAGMARTDTLAAFLRRSMPYRNPGTLSDEESRLIAAYITAQARPVFPLKELDYQVEPLPEDAVYYARR